MRSSIGALLALAAGITALLSGCDGEQSPAGSTGDTTSTTGGTGGTAGVGGSGGSGATCDGWVVENADLTTCNGSALLCNRRVDEVVFPTTHNAMSNIDDGWIAPNQPHRVTTQLHDGVRGLMLDTHSNADGVPSLCHGSCGFGQQPLVEGLGEIAQFLRCNPREVVVIIFEAYVSAQETDKAFQDSGLVEFVHTQPMGDLWPTLGELINQNHRLIALTDDPAGTPAYYHHVWDYAWDNPYAAETPADLKCELGRGSLSNSLFIFNHFLTAPVADINLAEQINHNPFFIDRTTACSEQMGDLPNFVTVDFYTTGDLFPVVNQLNGL
ncbi:MAG: hypothetical protein IPK82_37460 [Polyangiaceae bacterium]|nr:hypothetical protein [Polyangiaceae bacterium]